MSTVKTIAKNTGIFFFAQILGSVLSFFFFVYAARHLGANDFGIFSFALALGAIFGIFSDLGLSQITTREVSRDKSLSKKYLGNLIGIKIVLTISSFIVLIIFANIVGYSDTTIKVVSLIGLAVVFRAFTAMFSSIFQAYEKMEYDSIGIVLNSALMFLGVFFAIVLDLNVIGLAFIYLIVNIISFLYGFLICIWKFVKIKIETDWSFWKITLRDAMPFALVGVFTVVLNWIDTIMISMMKGDVATGWYNAAYRITFVLLFIPTALNTAIFPVMSRLHISSKEALRFAYIKSYKYLTILAIPMGVGGTILAERIIFLIFSSQYQPAILAFQILIWSAVLIFMGTPFTTLLSSTNRQFALMNIIGISAIFNIVLNVFLIPKYSYVGSSIATALSMLLILTIFIFEFEKYGYRMSIWEIVNPILRASCSSLIMGIFIIYFKNINLFLLIGISVIIYFIGIYFMKGLDKEDLSLIKKIFIRKKYV